MAGDSHAGNGAPKEKRRRFAARDPSGGTDDEMDGSSHNANELVAGRIMLIELENFMCHGNLIIPFDVAKRNCFYIGGPNGSGKSALFAALNLGLGGRGNQNDRGNSVKSYIKEGKNRAKIRITLTNEGANKMKQYGDSIVVERAITHTASSYALYSVVGRGQLKKETVVSKKKSDLDRITNQFGIQLDNPIFWMSQDRCRHFLNQQDPSKLYEIFNKATQLESTEEAYQQMETVLGDVERARLSLHEKLLTARQDYNNLVEQRKVLETSGKLQAQLDEFKWMLNFSPMFEARSKLEDYNATFDIVKAQAERSKQKYTTSCNDLQRLKDEIKQINDDISLRKENVDGFYGVIKDSEKVLQARKRELAEKEGTIRTALMDVRSNESLLQQRLAELKTLEEQSAKKIGGDGLAVTSAQMNKLKLEKEQLSEEIANAIKHQKSCEENLTESTQQHEKAKLILGSMQAKRISHDRDLQRNAAVSQNKMARYGNEFPAIVKVLDENKNLFEIAPRGPLGEYIQVHDPRWCLALENALHNVLKTFIFNSKRDEDTFKRLLARHRLKIPNTTVTNFNIQPHNVSNNEPASKWRTVLREVTIKDKDEVVRNAIIDLASIENTLLFDSDNVAREIMNGNCPEKSTTGFTISGAQVYGTNGGAKGHYRFYANRRNGTAIILSDQAVSSDVAIRRKLEELDANIQRTTSDIAQMRQQVTQDSSLKVKADNEVNRIKNTLTRINHSYQTLQRQVKMNSDQENNSNLTEVNAAIDEHRRIIETAKEEIEKLSGEKAEAKRRFDDADGELQEARDDLTQWNLDNPFDPHKLDDVKQQQNALAAHHEKLETAFYALNKKKEDMENGDERIELQRALDLAEEKAKKAETLPVPPAFTGPPNRDETGLTKDILAEMEMLNKRIESVKKSIEKNKPASDEDMKRFRESFTLLKKRHEILRQQCSRLKKMLARRKESVGMVRFTMQRNLNEKFQDVMRYRQYVGGLNINDEDKLIEISVTTHKKGDDNEENKQHSRKKGTQSTQDLKGLSGGERSYTTAAFVISLWAVMEAPFRCMDEFDVFMDMVNRKVVMDLLVREVTTSYKDSQFIFFTPQGITELHEKDKVAIFEMPKVRQ